MKSLAIALANLRRSLRQRLVVAQILLVPLMLILILGIAFGGSSKPAVGLVAAKPGPLAQTLRDALRDADGVRVVTVASEADLVRKVEHGELEAGVVIPAGYDTELGAGRDVTLRYSARSGASGQRIKSIVGAIVDRQAARLRAARLVSSERSAPLGDGVRTADAVAAEISQVSVEERTVGTASGISQEGRFDSSAYTQLLLFLFVTSLTSAVALVETRKLGLSRRMLTTPTTAWTVITGEALGRLALAVVQGLVIMLASALIFDVDWGDPLGAAALLVAFGLVGAGAGMLLGTLARTTQVASAIGTLLGLGLAALGGTMMPLEFFSPTMRIVAHVTTPHAWAIDGFITLIRHGGNITDIGRPLGVLLAAAAVLLGLASLRMHRSVAQ